MPFIFTSTVENIDEENKNLIKKLEIWLTYKISLTYNLIASVIEN